jgi:hypothetical protein
MHMQENLDAPDGENSSTAKSEQPGRPLSGEQASLFDLAVTRYGARCLWNCRPKRTVEGMLVVADRLKAHGNMEAWRLAMRLQEAVSHSI